VTPFASAVDLRAQAIKCLLLRNTANPHQTCYKHDTNLTHFSYPARKILDLDILYLLVIIRSSQ